MNRYPTMIEVRLDGTEAEQIAFAQVLARRAAAEYAREIGRNVEAHVPAEIDKVPGHCIQPRR